MLFNFLRFGVALIVLALLFMTSWNYLYAVLGNHVPGYAEDLLWAYLGIGLAWPGGHNCKCLAAEELDEQVDQGSAEDNLFATREAAA